MAQPDPPETAPVSGASLQLASEPLVASHRPTSTDGLGKRQRRPSVRLGEIGDQPGVVNYEAAANSRGSKQWRVPKEASKSNKTRPLTNLVRHGNGECNETLDSEERDFSGEGGLELGAKKLCSKKGSLRRPRTNWSMKMEYGDEGSQRIEGKNNAFEADMEDSPVHSTDNEKLSFWNRRPVRARASDSGGGAGIELDEIRELNSRDIKCDDSSGDGVRDWLIGIGLGRYVPVFEIHEVDDEVLPLLTLEDLKDMGINAVGSRRKMYTAIQKLRKGFS